MAKTKTNYDTKTASIIALIAFLIGVVVGGSVYLLKKESFKNVPTKSSETVETQNLKSDSVSESKDAAFEHAVNTKNYIKMKELMAPRVLFVIEATECCGMVTKNEAATRFENYVSEVKVFNFSQEQQVVKQLKVNMGDFFSRYTIGIGNNGAVLGYHLNQDGLVDDLYVAVSHTMFDLE